MIYRGSHNEYFELDYVDRDNFKKLRSGVSGALQLLWFLSDGNQLTIDGVPHQFDTNEIVSLSQYHQITYDHIESMRMLRFNSEFYCIINHDSQVGCKGVLYYTPAKIPVIELQEAQRSAMQAAWEMTDMELELKDELQLEMLQIVLKRILILCTRVYKMQGDMAFIDDGQHNLIREFNFLVDKHFRTNHNVAFYADQLNKSPKTITNTFKKISEKSPLQIIHDRIYLEAKNLLHFTDKDVSEIAYDLGYENVQIFSRFFKKQSGVSPSAFRVKQAV